MINNFINIARNTINEISDDLDQFNEKLEIDLVDNNLTIEFDDDKVFIISIHEPTQQIWLSSPLSGAHHFHLENEDKPLIWKSTRDNKIQLFEIIKKEIINALKKKRKNKKIFKSR